MCEHKRFKTVTSKHDGLRLFCVDCGNELPIEFLTKDKPEEKPKRKRMKKEEVAE